MDNRDLLYHFHPKNGWLNDPNGLVFFDGYYHVFFQYAPDYEQPWHEPMVWGHARTKDFLNWEELPVALVSDQAYDKDGVWSGTAAVFNGRLYVFYASVSEDKKKQTISMAYSDDGFSFTKYAGNPIIKTYPPEGSAEFRDPAIYFENGTYYLVIASSNKEKKTGNLLLYKSSDLENWAFESVLYECPGCKYCECPSFVRAENGYILSTSAKRLDTGEYFFEVIFGDFDGKKFTPAIVSHFQKGPDEYAGQIFGSPDGRNIMISWIPGWKYSQYEKCVGCLSLPLELTVEKDKIRAYPVKEVRHLLKDDLLVDGYITEKFVNGGEEVHIDLDPKLIENGRLQ